MGYGARARRVPALGGAILTDVDIFKIALMGKTERGLVDGDGNSVVHSEIYSMNDFYLKCGGFKSSFISPYVAQSFFDELERSTSCEMKVLNYVDVAAAQAAYSILDGATPGVSIFGISAGRKGLNDKSLFGNKIAIKITQINTVTMKLTALISDTDVTCTLDSVDNLEIGNYIKFTEGADTETRVITDINKSTRVVTFAAISESGGFSISETIVSRVDWELEVYVKDDLGNYQKKETWEGPLAQSNTIGLAADVNNTESGSDFVILAVNAANASLPEEQTPLALTTETPLTGGSDGATPGDSDWLTLVDELTSTEFTILLAPESASIAHNVSMISFCTDGYKGVFYSQAVNEAGEETLKNFGASCRGSIKFAMLPGDKWVKVNDPSVSGGKKDIPKVGIDAGFWFNVYSNFGESKVAAGNKSEMVLKTSATLIDTNALVHDDKNGVGGRLIRKYSVNICKYTRGRGITNNSARTFSTDDGYKYQNQIMQWILYSRSILAYLQQVEQDRSGASAMANHRIQVWKYMKGKYKSGHLFQGQREDGSKTTFEDVCIIVNDFSINTLANINNGIEEIFLQFVGVPPIEEPILSLASAPVTSVSA